MDGRLGSSKLYNVLFTYDDIDQWRWRRWNVSGYRVKAGPIFNPSYITAPYLPVNIFSRPRVLWLVISMAPLQSAIEKLAESQKKGAKKGRLSRREGLCS